jgi:uncharacterized protein (TIGR00369 family)
LAAGSKALVLLLRGGLFMNTTEIENRGMDERLFATLCSRYQKSPVYNELGIRLLYLGRGAAGYEIDVEHCYTTVNGRLHGGIIATMADSAMGWACLSLGRAAVTVDMNLNYFKPVFQETRLRAEGYVIREGKTLVVTEANLFNNEKLVAKSMGTFFLSGDIELIGAI